MAQLLDGIKASAQIRQEIKDQLNLHNECNECAPAPCLGVILWSEDPASKVYVEKKQQACREVGINSFVVKPFEGGIENWVGSKQHLLSSIKWLNEDKSVHGILVQLPLPSFINNFEIFDKIDPLKDVDVFNPTNVGLLLQGRPRFIPCTPAGIQELLYRNSIPIEGKKVAIINRSDIVGKPLNALLIQNNQQANATVTLCHDRTPPERLKQVCLAADIIVVAVGKPNFLTADLVPEGCVVIDVGINKLPDSKKIVGDVDFEAVSQKASWITKTPGGIGPMTIAMLLKNTVLAQKIQMDSKQ